jgi:hypothetical protein
VGEWQHVEPVPAPSDWENAPDTLGEQGRLKELVDRQLAYGDDEPGLL